MSMRSANEWCKHRCYADRLVVAKCNAIMQTIKTKMASWNMLSTNIVIDFYKKNEFLYKDSHADYRNGRKRKLKLKELEEFLSLEGFNFDETAIRKKWNSLKTNFNAEKAKVRTTAARLEGNGYTPTAWWWPLLQFLDDNKVEPGFVWDNTSTSILITYFEENECLYNDNMNEYKNKLLRAKKINDLISLLASVGFPNVTNVDIQLKWQALKLSFSREKAKMLATKTGTDAGDAYTPTAWWWDKMQFLVAKTQADDSIDNIEFQGEYLEEQPATITPAPAEKKKKVSKEIAPEQVLINCAGLMTSIIENSKVRKDPDEIATFVAFIDSELRACKNRSIDNYKIAKQSIIQILLNMQNSLSDSS